MKSWMRLLCAVSIGILFSTTLVRATEEVKEIGYDELVQQLNQKKSRVIKSSSDPFDQLKLHAGLGLLTSMNTVNTGGGKDLQKYQNGFQLSLGIDLFSPVWVAEAAIRNFGQAKSGTETRSLREFDLKFMNKDYISSGTGYRLGAGLGTRYLKISDGDLNIDESTPTALIFGGLDVYASKSVSIGFEGGFRTSMVNRNADKGGMDLSLRFDTYF